MCGTVYSNFHSRAFGMVGTVSGCGIICEFSGDFRNCVAERIEHGYKAGSLVGILDIGLSVACPLAADIIQFVGNVAVHTCGCNSVVVFRESLDKEIVAVREGGDCLTAGYRSR